VNNPIHKPLTRMRVVKIGSDNNLLLSQASNNLSNNVVKKSDSFRKLVNPHKPPLHVVNIASDNNNNISTIQATNQLSYAAVRDTTSFRKLIKPQQKRIIRSSKRKINIDNVDNNNT